MLKDKIIRSSTSPQKSWEEIGTRIDLPRLNSSKHGICFYRVKTHHGQICIISALLKGRIPSVTGLPRWRWQQRTPLPMRETQETQIRSLGQEDPLEWEIATHSSILAWQIARTEEPCGLQSMGSQSQRRLSTHSASVTDWTHQIRSCATEGRLHHIVLYKGLGPLGMLVSEGFWNTSNILT